METGKQMDKREPKWLQGRKPIRSKQIHPTELLKISRTDNARFLKAGGKEGLKTVGLKICRRGIRPAYGLPHHESWCSAFNSHLPAEGRRVTWWRGWPTEALVPGTPGTAAVDWDARWKQVQIGNCILGSRIAPQTLAAELTHPRWETGDYFSLGKFSSSKEKS